MPRESQETQLARYRDRIEGARSWRENEGYISLWRRMIDMYRGKQVSSDDPDADEAMVNLCFSVLNIITASVTTQYPKFTVQPNQMDQGPQATIAEAVLNYSWRHYNFHDEFTRAVVDMCMLGHGWLKVGWDYKEHTETQTLSPEEQYAQVSQGQAQADTAAAMMNQPPAPPAGLPPGPVGGAPGGLPPEMMGQPPVTPGVGPDLMNPGAPPGPAGPPVGAPPSLGPAGPPEPGAAGPALGPAGMPPGPMGTGLGPTPMGPNPMESMGGLGGLSGNPAELPSDEEIAAQVEPNQRVTVVDKDDPYVRRCSPFDVVVDPEATCERELRWIAERTVRDLKEVQDDESYDARARHKVQSDMSLTNATDVYDPARATATGLADEESDRVTVWEFYDLQDKQWAVFAASGEGFLMKPSPLPYDFDNCYIQFRDYDVPDSFYPMGEVEAVETLQEELNKTRTQQINARKQYVRKFIGREAALTPSARTALTSEIDGDVALVDDDDRPLNDVLIPAPALMFDPQIFIQHSGQIVNDLQMVTGLSDYQFGQMPDTRRLATEAMAVEGSTNARAQYKLTRVERTLALVGRRLLQVMQQYLDTERVARVVGPGGQMLFTYQPDDIKGEFDLEVEAGSTQPKNDMIRRQEAITLFNTLAPMMGMYIDPFAMITYLLAQGYDIKGAERFLMQPPPPPPMPGQEQGQGSPPQGAGAAEGGPVPPGGGPPSPVAGGAGPPATNGAPVPPVPVGG